MASPVSLPLHERIRRKNTIPRAVELIILFLLISLLIYRLLNREHHGVSWLMAFFCELFFTFVWILTLTTKWNQVDFITHPERLKQWAAELPPVDIFVTTADPALEPPIITVNTVLSLLALDYPANKLACYVSDDGASPLTFFALIEASKFAKLWVPFCNKYKVQIRAPFRYFSRKTESLAHDTSMEFQQEWKKMKDAYKQLSQKVEDAATRSLPCDLTGDFAVFSNIEGTNHQTIIKVILENHDSNRLPHLVYISREKHPKHPHHFKAGAMNVLTRVSGVMTNAPFMLNVDCDMFVNNSQIILHAMCLHIGIKNERDCAFVQCPQHFYDAPKDDPFGNQLTVMHEYIGSGTSGIQGPFYGGTGCFHRRKVIYGLSPDEKEINGKLSDEYLEKRFGNSKAFNKSATQIFLGLNGKSYTQLDHSTSLMEAACKVSSCVYEHGTSWGTQVGWLYGSTTEDILTGLTIHGKGWRSALFNPKPDAFLGCAPSSWPSSMIQQKRWATGLLEILISPRSPLIATLTGKLQFRQWMAYMWILGWPLRSIPELCYAVLPAFSIITNSHFLPKVQESAILIPVSIFVIYNLYTLSEYLQIGLSIREWWNNQRMWRVNAMSAWLFGMLSVILKLLGLSETVFEVTQKEQTSGDDDNNVPANAEWYTYNESPIFIPGTTILMVHLMALAIGVLGFGRVCNDGNGCGIGEFIGSLCVVLCFWPYLKGLFGKGKYGIPSSTIYKSGALALLFVQFCKWTSMG
ncbi:cellulose synthase-like protein H1 isoform X1 [Cornus florida]|uniref:cellulose synthase-like protein H1 isoform X1 n=1 Tax=Cornus florida TaxID=4283 RepID=UPI00289BBB62|nr:cellulose synthase-like protein H1 isoform X1 [Cornus florida]